MGLLERVTTLIRANLNDLVDRAEEPEKMIKQVILDMQNQLMQVKTQVAMSLADLHLLEGKQRENEDKMNDWMRKAELAVDKQQEDLARGALERYKNHERLAANFTQQVNDQRAQVENLKNALHKLEQKLAEAQAKAELLLAQHRRARTSQKASAAHQAMTTGSSGATFDRMKDKVMREEAVSQAHAELLTLDSVEDRFDSLEKEEEIDRMLEEIKQRRRNTA